MRKVLAMLVMIVGGMAFASLPSSWYLMIYGIGKNQASGQYSVSTGQSFDWSTVTAIGADDIYSCKLQFLSNRKLSSATISTSAPTGYHWAWYTTKEGKAPSGIASFNLDNVIADSATITAAQCESLSAYGSTYANAFVKQTPNRYEVVFNSNGGSGYMDEQEFEYGKSQALTANSFSRFGYTFKGWDTDSAATTVVYVNSQSVSNLTAQHGGTVNLYAVWQVNSYNLSLTLNEGIARIYYKVNGASSYTATTSSTVVPVDYGSTWYAYAEADVGYRYTSTSVTAPAFGVMNELGASFSATGSILSYDISVSVDGIGSTKGEGRYAYGSAAKLVAVETSENSRFVRWSDGSTSKEHQITVVSNADYVAYFALNKYTVRFKYYDSSGIERTTDPQLIEHGKSATPPDNSLVSHYPNHVFTGWDSAYANITASKDINAVYRNSKYTIFYNGNGATSGSMTMQELECNKLANLTACQFIKTGHVFLGWNEDPNAKTAVYGNQASVIDLSGIDGATIVFYAIWQPATYTIDLVTNGGTIQSGDIKSYVYGEGATLPSEVTKEQCQFAGWFADFSCLGKVVTEISTTDTGDKTFYAKWNHCITYAPGQYGREDIVVQVKPKGESIQLRGALFTAVGRTQDGWSNSDGGSKSYDLGEIYYSDNAITLYPHWQVATPTINFNKTGGQGGTMSTMATFGNLLPEISLPTRNGYDFAGYFTAIGGSGTMYYDKNGSAQVYCDFETNVTVCANWNPHNYSVEFVPNGGLGEMLPQAFVYGVTQALKLNEFSSPGLSFLGWRGEGGEDYDDGDIVSNLTTVAGGTYVLTARWSDTRYVRFDANGGEGEMPLMSFEGSEEKSLCSNEYFRIGFAFTNWLDRATGNEYADGAQYTMPSGMPLGGTNVLSAVWSTNAYTVVYYPNGGTGAVFEVQHYCHTPYELASSNVFGREGCEFNGWALDPCAAEADFYGNEVVSNLSYIADAKVRLYALWKGADLPEVSDFSRAVDCDNLNITNLYGDSQSPNWKVISNAVDIVVGGNDQYAKCLSKDVSSYMQSSLFAILPKARGRLSFWYKTKISPEVEDPDWQVPNSFECSVKWVNQQPQEQPYRLIPEMSTNVVNWTKVEYLKSEWREAEVRWTFMKNDGLDSEWSAIDMVTWEPEGELSTVGVTFRLNDGTIAPDDVWANYTCTTGVAYCAWPKNPASDQGKFLGWFTAPTEGTQVVVTDIVPRSDVCLYAHWGTKQPTEQDRREVSSVVKTTTGYSLTIGDSDSEFKYQVIYCNALPPEGWLPLPDSIQVGTGSELQFDIPIDPTLSTRFFKIRTLAK